MDGRFLPPQHVLAKIPGLYETEEVPAEDKVVWLHYYVASSDWWVVELSPDHQLAFGFVRLRLLFLLSQDSEQGHQFPSSSTETPISADRTRGASMLPEKSKQK